MTQYCCRPSAWARSPTGPSRARALKRPASPCAAEEGKGGKAQAGDAAANDVGQEEPAVPNRGTLKVDAKVAPQHVGHPTDTRLLAEARECTEQLIDKLFYGVPEGWPKNPRTYRRNAKNEYLSFSKKRSPRKSDIKRVRGKQLRYLRRNLGHINRNFLKEKGIRHIKLGGAFLLLCAALLAALAAAAVAARRPLAGLNSKMGRPLRGRPALVVQSGIGALAF